MMRKNKVFRIIVLMILLLVVIVITACNTKPANNNDGEKDGSNPPIDTDNPTPLPEGGHTEDPILITDLIKQFKVITTGDVSVFDPITRQETSFNNLLDRQIDVLATDILYRLAVVYGNGFNSEDDSYVIESDYKYNSQYAKIDNKDVIIPNIDDKNDEYKYFNIYYETVNRHNFQKSIINDPAYFAFSLNTDKDSSGTWNFSHTISIYFRNTNAINGGYKWNTGIGKFDETSNFNYEYRWEWDYDKANIDVSGASKVYDEYIDYYKNYFKNAIAQILAGEDYINLNNDDYQSHLNNIKYLGFKPADRQKIENFVFNEIIGTYNVNTDEDIFNSLVNYLDGYILNPDNLDLYDFFEYEELHYYKAYKTLVPAMLERAFSNSFGGIEIDRVIYTDEPLNTQPKFDSEGKVQYHALDNYNSIYEQNGETFVSLYPKMTRSQDTNIVLKNPKPDEVPDFFMLGKVAEINSVILQPKKGSAISSLLFAVEGQNGLSFDFKIKLTYVANGKEYVKNTYLKHDEDNGSTDIYKISGRYDLSPEYTNEGINNMPFTFFLDIESLVKKNMSSKDYPLFGDYDELESNYNNLWDNLFSYEGYQGAVDNYIELTFEIVSATKNGQPYNGEVNFDIGFAYDTNYGLD